MRHNLKLPLILVLATLITFGGVFYLEKIANAQGKSGQAFSISPPLVDMKAKPGQTVTAKITLTNVSNGELLIKNQFNDFGAKNETGEPSIVFDDNDSTAYSLRQWISGPPPFVLKSKESRTIDFSIRVPKEAEPGGHYAVIMFTGTAPELEESGVALKAGIGTLVLLRVEGKIENKASLVEFFSSNGLFAKASFFETGNLGFVTRIKNEGNVHIKPTGTIEIKDMSGKVVQKLRFNGDPSDPKDQPHSILPGSIRRFEQAFDQSWMLGRYEATLDVKAAGNIHITDKVTFWVIPWKLIVLSLVGIGLGFFLLKSLIKKYNRHIIKKARGR